MNLLQLRTLVLSWLDQQEDSETSYFKTSQVNRWLNNAQKEIGKILHQAGENYYLKIVQTDTVANQADYVLPSDFKKLNRLEIVLSGTGVNENRLMLGPTTLNQSNGYTPATGTPYCYILKKNRITVIPTPNNVFTLRLYYSPLPVDMTLDTDVPDVPDEYHEAIAVFAAFDGFVKDDRVPSTLVAKKEEYLRMMRMQSEDRTVDLSRQVRMLDDDLGIMF